MRPEDFGAMSIDVLDAFATTAPPIHSCDDHLPCVRLNLSISKSELIKNYVSVKLTPSEIGDSSHFLEEK